MSEIKRCPFCGNEVTIFKKKYGWLREKGDLYKYGGMCNTPHCFMIPADFQTEEEVTKAINTRKPMERIISRLEKEKFSTLPTFDEDGYCNDDSWEVVDFDTAIEIVKEEGGIE